ncbi:MAG: AEC family transporter [Ruminococcus sp.]|uniref:AEC family transporter n=1 Tax=Ruminococcus sp. TaxID=41978 RepID=UPI001B08E950|nr:AEC family transporter [Ruminococcus sp.]MBO7475251.1 AEC family transporter [Ruminococcus sp.]
MASTILYKTAIMLILIGVGILCAKTGLISKASNRDLSKFMLQVVNPVVIFMSYQTDYRSELVRNLLLTFVLALGTMALAIALSYLFVRRKEGREFEIERFSSVYSNCGFMGIPLVNAIYGSEGVFYLTAYITVFNLIVWTHGVILISGEKDFRQVVKVFYSPTIIAIFLGMITFFLRIRLPGAAAEALGLIKEVNTPMAMIVSGVTISGTNMMKMLKNHRVYYICLLKLMIVPLIISVPLSLLSEVDNTVRMTVLVAAAAPPATMCTLLSLRYGKNSIYASEIFAAGTILSVVTLPLIVKTTEHLTKIL